MKNFRSWGVRVRNIPDCKYKSMWINLKTARLDSQPLPLPPDKSEFYDIAINTKCNLACPFCYTEASSNGVNYEGVVDTWNKWMEIYKEEKSDFITITDKPFQVAIGSTGEPTLHPEFCNLLKAIYESNVAPSYTTNGVILSAYLSDDDKNHELAVRIMEATKLYCGGVAVSVNKYNEKYAYLAINALIEAGECKVNTHYIISDKQSVDDFVKFALDFMEENDLSKVNSHLLLPLMAHGRSDKGIEEGIFKYLIEQCKKHKIENISFGANFTLDLLENKDIVNVWMYPPEYMSKNVILDNGEVKFTPNSFNLTPCKTLKFF